MIKNVTELLNILSDNPSPYLFIGSGFSKRYIGIPDWEGLLKKIADKYNLPLNEYIYESRDELLEKKIDYSKVGSYLKEGIIRHRQAQDREFDYRKVDVLKEEVSNLLMNMHENIKNVSTDIIEEISSFKILLSNISAIITTNYDYLIEALSDGLDYEPYIGQSGIINGKLSFAKEIYKIHGCVKDVDSIIITKEDYADFLERQKYILGKLTVIFTEYPIVFLGYSVNDDNIIKILTDLAISLKRDELEKITKKWIFIDYKKDEKNLVFSTRSVRLTNKGELFFSCISTDNYKEVYEVLSQVKNKIPPDMKLIKYIRKMIYDYELNPASTVQLCPNDTFEQLIKTFNNGENITVDFGVKTSHFKLTFTNLTQDMLFKKYNFINTHSNFSEAFVKDMRNNTYFPRYCFFSSSQLETMKKSIHLEEILKVVQLTNNVNENFKTSSEFKLNIKYWTNKVFSGSATTQDLIDVENFLKTIFESIETDYDLSDSYKNNDVTLIKKLVTGFDILTNKK